MPITTMYNTTNSAVEGLVSAVRWEQIEKLKELERKKQNFQYSYNKTALSMSDRKPKNL